MYLTMQSILKHVVYRIELQCISDCQFKMTGQSIYVFMYERKIFNNKLTLNLKLIYPSVDGESNGNLTACLCVCLCLCVNKYP